MQTTVKIAALRESFGQEGKEKRDEIVFFCPRHGAKIGRTEGQLSVNVKTDEFHCWSCGFGGKNLLPLLRLKGETRISREYFLERESIRRGQRCTFTNVPTDGHEVPYLPKGFLSLSIKRKDGFSEKALSYLASRGLTTDDLLLWKLGYVTDGEYKGRVIIPSFDFEGQLNFFTARAFDDSKLRYLQPHFDKNIVWNAHMIDWSQRLCIAEGPFDAFVIRENVTILQGTSLSQALIEEIVVHNTPVMFAMDSDAFARQLQHIKLFLSYGVRCWFVDLGGAKDPGSMTREVFNSRKDKALEIKSELDILKMRLRA